jgi:hypothetical protein
VKKKSIGRPGQKRSRAKRPRLPTLEEMRRSLPDPRTVAVLDGLLDAAEEEVPESLREVAPVMRAACAMLFSLADKPFTVDPGVDAVATIVRPVDARAVAVRAVNDLTTRALAKAAFKKKLGKR